MNKIAIVFALFLLISLSYIVQGTEDGSKSYQYGATSITIGMRENFEPNPQIKLTPDDLSFTESDIEYDLKKRVTISIYNPPNCNITRALIKITSPIGWEITPDLNHTEIDYVSSENAFYLENFNESKTINEWFEIKPGRGVKPNRYSLMVTSTIHYEAKNEGLWINGNDPQTPKKLIKINEINLTLEETSWTNQMKNNAWIFAFISAIGVIITVIFGPGIGRKLVITAKKLISRFFHR